MSCCVPVIAQMLADLPTQQYSMSILGISIKFDALDLFCACIRFKCNRTLQRELPAPLPFKLISIQQKNQPGQLRQFGCSVFIITHRAVCHTDTFSNSQAGCCWGAVVFWTSYHGWTELILGTEIILNKEQMTTSKQKSVFAHASTV